MEVIYRAFDGTEFIDEIDCMDYEREKKFDVKQIDLCIFADEFGKKMKTPTGVQELLDTYERSRFWFIPKKATDVIEQINEKFFVPLKDEISSDDDVYFTVDELDKMIELAHNLEQTFPMLNQKKKEKEG